MNQLPQSRDIIAQALQHLAVQRVLRGEHVHTQRTAYEATIAKVLPLRPSAERNLLHVAYEHLRVAGVFLNGYHSDLLADIAAGVVTAPFAACEDHLRAMLDTLESVESLLRLLRLER